MIKNGIVDPKSVFDICNHSNGKFFFREKYIGDRKVYIVNYRYIDGLWTDFTKEFRGLVFDEYGYVLARPFAKFFNFGEKDCPVDLDTEVICNEKIDGSMIVLWNHFGMQTTTRGTFDSDMISYVKEHTPEHMESVVEQLVGYTPIFEFTSPKFRIVIPYTEDKLTLVGVRNIEDGSLTDPVGLVNFAETYGLFAPRIAFQGRIEFIVDSMKTLQNLEGLVGYTKDGDLVKLKTAWYFERNHLFNLEQAVLSSTDPVSKPVATAFFTDTLDELLAVAQPDLKREIEKQVNVILSQLKGLTAGTRNILAEIMGNKILDRKTFALRVKEKAPQDMRGIYFRVFDGKSVDNEVFSYLRKLYGV